jgi:hypothetical protein
MYRAHVADHAEITFAATVKHIVWAVRKLSALTPTPSMGPHHAPPHPDDTWQVRKLSAVATPDEMETELWRAVRGEVPKSFW